MTEKNPTKEELTEILLESIDSAVVQSGDYLLLRSETVSLPLGRPAAFHMLGGIINFSFQEGPDFRFVISSIEDGGGGVNIGIQYRKEDAAASPGFGTPDFINIMLEPTIALSFTGLLSERTVSLNVCFWGLADEVSEDVTDKVVNE